MKSLHLTIKLLLTMSLVFFLHRSIYASVSTGKITPFDEMDFKYQIFLVQTLDKSFIPTMTLEQIKKNGETNAEIKKSFVGAIKKSILPLNRFMNPDLLTSGVNLQSEVTKMLTVFSNNLKEELKQIKISKTVSFQLKVVPVKSEDRVAIDSENNRLDSYGYSGVGSKDVPFKRLYSRDKFSIYEPMILPTQDAPYKDAETVIAQDVYNGLVDVVKFVVNKDHTKPFFLTTSFNIDLLPDVNKSKISIDSVVGLPTNIDMPFTESNEKISFEKILFPEFDLTQVSYNLYPCAFIKLVNSFNSSDILMHIDFGPLGTIKDGQWVRATNIDDIKVATPKLYGKAKKFIGVNFNVFNLSVNISKQEVSNLDMFLSIGAPIISRNKIGTINNTSVDKEFETEINKQIQANLKKLDEKKNQLVAKIESGDVASMLETIFTIVSKQ